MKSKTGESKEEGFREPTDGERKLLMRLLQADFPGRTELASLVESSLVKIIDEDGGLELRAQREGKALVTKRVPVEAEASDSDGVTIHMLLHVVDGKPTELEI